LLEQAGIHDDPYYTLTKLVGPQLAELTEAPGAPPPAEGSDEQRIDTAMDSVDQLRMDGKLDKLLPALNMPTGGIAHSSSTMPSQPPATTALSH
jgi:hypothetical protein